MYGRRKVMCLIVHIDETQQGAFLSSSPPLSLSFAIGGAIISSVICYEEKEKKK
jgi:hypothetical protein